MTSPNIALLLTGNELMTGDTVDSNSARIAKEFLDHGFEIHYKVTVSDELSILVEEIKRLSNQFDVVLMNGGLGPTTDDLTAEALSLATGSQLIEHPKAMTHLQSWCERRNQPLNPQNRKQALLPECVDIVPNPVGSAVGFSCLLNQCLLICTPGVPTELSAMLDQSIVPLLKQHFIDVNEPRRYRLRVFGMGESGLQKRITDAFHKVPDELEIGFRASVPLLELKLKVDQADQHSMLDEWRQNMYRLLGDHIVTEDSRTLAHVVMDLLKDQDKTVTFAESCTGGLIASSLTEISGSSAVFEAGYITYSNMAKINMIGVSQNTLEQHGAVSEAVVREMLSGALKHSGADIGVAVSGIAGPTGGTDEKPVGTVWVAWGEPDSIQARQFYFPGNRLYFQKIVAALGLDLIRRTLIESDQEPAYFYERIKK